MHVSRGNRNVEGGIPNSHVAEESWPLNKKSVNVEKRFIGLRTV